MTNSTHSYTYTCLSVCVYLLLSERNTADVGCRHNTGQSGGRTCRGGNDSLLSCAVTRFTVGSLTVRHRLPNSSARSVA